MELKLPRAPLLVVLPHPVVLASNPGPAPVARARSWAEVAAGAPGSSKRPRADASQEATQELSSVLADARGESEMFEDILAAALNA